MRFLLIFCLLLPAFAGTNPFFVFDNGIGRGTLPAEAQAELAKKTGFDGVGYTPQANFAEMLAALDARGLKMFNIYLVADISKPAPYYPPAFIDAVRRIQGRDTMILLAINGRAEDAEARALSVIRTFADLTAGQGQRVVLYPHYGFYTNRVEDALRLAEASGRPNVGVAFNLCHWLRVGDEKNMVERLRQALPRLDLVSINGADHTGDWDRLIQPLDRGDFDVHGFLETLRSLGYTGPIGLQCYKVPGELEENLRRSMAAWRRFTAGRNGSKPLR
jgi:sugar phosphate isomerase/epimerase